MRLAVLTMRDLDESGETAAPMLRVFAGRTLAERQFDLALDLGCTLVACCIDRLAEPVLALQRRAEAAGVRFVIVRAGRGLAGAATAGDEVLVLAPGLLPEADTCAALLDAPVVLTLPADKAIALGYERIDAGAAWAGALVARGAVIEGLAHLPDDADVASSLLRLALQTGTRRRALDPALLDRGHWQLAPSEEELAERAARWVGERAALASFAAPGRAVAERVGLRLGRGVTDGSTARAPILAGLVAALGALALALAEMPVAALAAVLLAALLAAGSAVIARISEPRRGAAKPERLTRALDAAIDPALVVALAAAAPEADGWLRLFVPVVLLLALALAERHGPARQRPLMGDRILLAAILLPAAVFGLSQMLAAALALAALLLTLLRPGEA